MLARVGRAGGSPSSSSLRLAAFLVTAMLSSVGTAALPYIPTSVLAGADTNLYIFAPNGRSVDLLEVNYSSTLSASSLKPKTLVPELPFLKGSDRVAFTPTVLDNGILAVFAGDCAVATDAALWTYKPGASGSAAWAKHTTSPSKNWDYGQGGPYFLGGSLSFSAQLAPVVSDPTLYVYGGMCPSSNSTGGGEQSSATYSNRMLKLSPPITSNDAASYTVSYAPTAGPPIAEAGFTFTELAPSISNRSGIVTQQTSHVLLGGHTQQAFINMSTAAIWSLPEETWNFVSISIPPTVGSGKNDLLVKDTSNSVLAAATASSIDSRSGHTAVLSEDGTSLIILGGWVGDTKQAAEPQLAVIQIGASFSDWQWMIPAAQPTGLGFYGHGATLLPGNVMMVYGGYEISGGSKLRRRASNQMFFNMSSLTWTDTYNNPGYSLQKGTKPKPGSGSPNSPSNPSSSGGSQSDHESASSSNNKLPLGLGLGLGIPFLLIVLGLGFCLYRRRARRRAERDEAIRGLSQGMTGGALPFHHRTDSGEMLERDENIFPWNASSARDWYTGGHDPYVQGRRSLGYESLRGGNVSKGAGGFVPLPPPMARPRGAARGLYQPSTGFGGGGSGGGEYGAIRAPMKNEIHPIYEDDEEEEQDAADVPLSPTRDECDDDDDDPFATPTNRSTPTTALFPPPSNSSGSNRGDSPERQGGGPGGQSQDAEVQGWVSDVDAADAVLTAKIGRHGSTTTTPPRLNTSQLHPQSAAAGSRAPIHRRNSNRSSEPDERTNSNLSDRSTFSFVAGAERNVSVLRPPKHRHTNSHDRLGTAGSSTSGGSYSTAKSTFAALQAEGPTLLAGDDHEDEDYVHIPGSPSKSKPRRSWLGSLKRVFSGGTPSENSSRGDSPTRESLLNESGSSDYEPRLVGMGPNGRLLTRRKQGREAWDGGEGSTLKGDEEDEWDIERAVEQRLVQVMFTVPRERLRVVNAEIEKEEEVVVVTPGEEGEESFVGGDEKGVEAAEERGVARGMADEKSRGVEGMRSSERLRGSRSGERLRGSGTADIEKISGEEWSGQNARLSRELDSLLGLGDEKFSDALRFAGDEKWSQRSTHEDIDDDPFRSHTAAQQERAEEAAASLLFLRPEAAEREKAQSQPGLSPSASLRTSSMTTTTLHTAEAVRMERPRTRVLEMVESIESKSSRESTPGGSPVRGG
ncbi:hypothetical protein B0T16DRAFT_390216 [Cercophora newfieldiana]|uniref:Galactose oxidase n=1 Tax=Cercophora newfieldiana TaxID=92897 RepID=A0AA39Y409_9PEZI|nr:hypothetical protein B0T16DRAFT_390216 [Cercophora newfieldiana]